MTDHDERGWHWDYEAEMRRRDPDATWPKPTAWQRFWRSPWTELMFMILFFYYAQHSFTHGWLHFVFIIMGFWSAWDFIRKANKRWGTP